jgi:hypothetical protein
MIQPSERGSTCSFLISLLILSFTSFPARGHVIKSVFFILSFLFAAAAREARWCSWWRVRAEDHGRDGLEGGGAAARTRQNW